MTTKQVAELLRGELQELRQAIERLAGSATRELPELGFTSDIAESFHVSEAAARRMILRGELGPFNRIGRRYVLRRESILEHLESQQVMPEPPPPAIGTYEPSRPTAAAKALLKRLESNRRGLTRSPQAEKAIEKVRRQREREGW